MPWIVHKIKVKCPICQGLSGWWMPPQDVWIDGEMVHMSTTWFWCDACGMRGNIEWYEQEWISPQDEVSKDEE